MKRKQEPRLWLTVLKLLLGASVLIGLVALALWYAAQWEQDAPAPASRNSWGIVGDSPIRNQR